MRPRDERAHPVVKDAISRGFVGSGRPYHVDGLASEDAADEARRSINNAARHLGVSCSSTRARDVAQLTDGTWRVSFRLWPKNQGRQHIHQVTGGDPANLAYNPFRRAAPRALDDDGQPFQPR